MALRDPQEMIKDARVIFEAGIRAVDPYEGIRRCCKMEGNVLDVNGRSYDLSSVKDVYIVGAGKASARMAQGLEIMLGRRVKGGIINCKYGEPLRLDFVEVHEAGHPIPDRNGVRGSKRILDLARRADEKDLLLCVLSGGGSALLPLPVDEISLEEKQETTEVLLSCGAPINEINAVRKHISLIKGGRLAEAAFPAQVISLILSDVIGDPIDVIASGPTVADGSCFQDCIDIFEKYSIKERIPPGVLEYIKRGQEGKVQETPKPGDPLFERTQNVIIGNNLQCLMAARQMAIDLGYNAIVLSTLIQGDTGEAARFHAAVAKEVVRTGNPVERPACIISGGETTVVVRGSGKGGRNQEFVLAFAMEIEDLEGVVVLSGGTDGTDGLTDAAGAIADGHTIKRARQLGIEARDFLKNNDSYHFFKAIDGLLITGPTNTNVMDLRIIIIS